MTQQFGKYLLLKRLALGGMAEIWLSKQLGVQGFEKLVVVKRILEQFAGEKEFVQMFLDEARLAATLNHPNVVQIYDLGQE
ncbi:MAG TPA: protein kinase, partial [Archangium sp.]